MNSVMPSSIMMVFGGNNEKSSYALAKDVGVLKEHIQENIVRLGTRCYRMVTARGIRKFLSGISRNKKNSSVTL